MLIAKQHDLVEAQGWLKDLFDGATFEKVSDWIAHTVSFLS
jgi:hypothetical protein